MSDAVGFAFLAGSALGFLAGLMVAANVIDKIERMQTKNGIMQSHGVVYKITRVDP